MKKILFFDVVLLLMLIGGCGMQNQQIETLADAGAQAGKTIQGIGTVMGNPAMVTYGLLIFLVSDFLATIIVRKGRKNGNS